MQFCDRFPTRTYFCAVFRKLGPGEGLLEIVRLGPGCFAFQAHVVRLATEAVILAVRCWMLHASKAAGLSAQKTATGKYNIELDRTQRKCIPPLKVFMGLSSSRREVVLDCGGELHLHLKPAQGAEGDCLYLRKHRLTTRAFYKLRARYSKNTEVVPLTPPSNPQALRPLKPAGWC